MDRVCWMGVEVDAMKRWLGLSVLCCAERQSLLHTLLRQVVLESARRLCTVLHCAEPATPQQPSFTTPTYAR